MQIIIIIIIIIQNRLEGNPRPEPGHGNKQASTTDHLQAVNQLIEKSNEYQLNICLGFIDYQKAFDDIEQRDIFDALRIN